MTMHTGTDPYAADDGQEHAGEDTLIHRPDLGPGCHTLIAAGDPIPPDLAHLPRTPRTTTTADSPADSTKGKRGRT